MTTKFNTIRIPKHSAWRCYLFGAHEQNYGYCWTPEEGKEPNWFWRWMQWICFGNKWVYTGKPERHYYDDWTNIGDFE